MTTTTNTVSWSRPELLSTADAWAAWQTISAILADAGRPLTNENVRHEAQAGRTWALSQPDAICDRWAPAYARVANAL